MDALEKLNKDWERVKHICLTNAKTDGKKPDQLVVEGFGCQEDNIAKILSIILGKPFQTTKAKPFTFIIQEDKQIFLHYEDDDIFGFGFDWEDDYEFGSGDEHLSEKEVRKFLSNASIEFITGACKFYNENKKFIENEFKRDPKAPKSLTLKQKIAAIEKFLSDEVEHLYGEHYRKIVAHIFSLMALKTPPVFIKSKLAETSNKPSDADLMEIIRKLNDRRLKQLDEKFLLGMFKGASEFNQINKLEQFHPDIAGILSSLASSRLQSYFKNGITLLSSLHPNLKSLQNGFGHETKIKRGQLVKKNDTVYIIRADDNSAVWDARGNGEDVYILNGTTVQLPTVAEIETFISSSCEMVTKFIHKLSEEKSE